jgi:hypothetical protein
VTPEVIILFSNSFSMGRIVTSVAGTKTILIDTGENRESGTERT